MSKKKKVRADSKAIQLDQLKELVVIAMFSDDELMDRLVLKGGNALDLIHRMSTRGSFDFDFSIQDDLSNEERGHFYATIESSLKQTFREAGYEVIDFKAEARPPEVTREESLFWGGYSIEFKLVKSEVFEQFSGDFAQQRRRALSFGKRQKIIVEISKFEYIEGKEEYFLKGFKVSAYSMKMIVFEKLRAICQQMPEYSPVIKRTHPGSARARDFFDIYNIMTRKNLKLESDSDKESLSEVFKAKRVPISLLGRIRDYKEFHRPDFPSVKDTIRPGDPIHEFDEYFDYVVTMVARLKTLWNI